MIVIFVCKYNKGIQYTVPGVSIVKSTPYYDHERKGLLSVAVRFEALVKKNKVSLDSVQIKISVMYTYYYRIPSQFQMDLRIELRRTI